METTRLSTKGQVTLSSRIRSAHKWQPGLEFSVEETPDGVLLRPLKPFMPTRLEDVFGCADYVGPARTIAEMDVGIAR